MSEDGLSDLRLHHNALDLILTPNNGLQISVTVGHS
jgi:hypothetical protein